MLWPVATVAARDALFELTKARAKFGPQRSAHEGYAVILKELDELWDEVKCNPKDWEAIRKEAVQVAAMALRFIEDVCDSPGQAVSCPTTGHHWPHGDPVPGEMCACGGATWPEAVERALEPACPDCSGPTVIREVGRDHPGKTIEVCETCEEQRRERFRALFPPAPNPYERYGP